MPFKPPPARLVETIPADHPVIESGDIRILKKMNHVSVTAKIRRHFHHHRRLDRATIQSPPGLRIVEQGPPSPDHDPLTADSIECLTAFEPGTPGGHDDPDPRFAGVGDGLPVVLGHAIPGQKGAVKIDGQESDVHEGGFGGGEDVREQFPDTETSGWTTTAGWYTLPFDP